MIAAVSFARLSLIALTIAGCGRVGFDPLASSCESDPELCVDATVALPPDAAVPPDAALPDAAPMIVPIDTDVAPVVVSGGAACSSGVANLNRDIGVDASNNIYVVFECEGALTVVVSADGGVTYSDPVDLGVAAVDSIAVHGDSAGVAYVVAGTADTVELLKTVDGGQSWTPNTVGAITGDKAWGVSLAVAGDSIYVARRQTDVRVFANHAQGDGAFTSVDVAMENAFGDVLADPITNDVFVVTDTPEFHIRRSSDGGLSFDAEVNPPGFYHYSDWTLADSTIFVAGQEDSFARIPLSDITTSVVTAPVLTASLPQSRSIAAASDGSFFASQVDGTTSELTITHFPAGSDSGTTVPLPAGAIGGSLVAASSTVVVYLYTTETSQVAVGVEAF